MNNVIIICAGEQERWGDYLGVRKHFIEIDGERLLNRTVRLLRAYPNNKITIVAKNKDYQIEGTELYIPKTTKPTETGMDKFLSSKELWTTQKRNIILYGDCYYTKEAIRKICTIRDLDWLLFARPYRNRLTGHDCAECFAFSFNNNAIETINNGITNCVELDKSNELIWSCGGWTLYRVMEELNPNENYFRDHLIVIDDWSEDFDCPRDYDLFIKNYEIKKQNNPA